MKTFSDFIAEVLMRWTMAYIWTPLFLVFAWIEFTSPTLFCGSLSLTGRMWFMWLMMGLAASGSWWSGLTKKADQ